MWNTADEEANTRIMLVYSTFLMVMQYILPLAIISGTYGVIAWRIWGHQMPGEGDAKRDRRVAKSKRKVSRCAVSCSNSCG